jgi:hypothetical protein
LGEITSFWLNQRRLRKCDPISSDEINESRTGDLTVALLALGVVIGMAIRNRRGFQVRVLPKSLEVDLEPPEEKKVAEAGLEPARGLPPTGF